MRSKTNLQLFLKAFFGEPHLYDRAPPASNRVNRPLGTDGVTKTDEFSEKFL